MTEAKSYYPTHLGMGSELFLISKLRKISMSICLNRKSCFNLFEKTASSCADFVIQLAKYVLHTPVETSTRGQRKMIKKCVLEYAKRSGEFRVVKQFAVIFVRFICAVVLSLHDARQGGWGHGGHPQDKCWALSLFFFWFALYVSFALQSTMEHKTCLSSIEWDRTWAKTFLIFLF